jgi:uncharacterized protein YkwD
VRYDPWVRESLRQLAGATALALVIALFLAAPGSVAAPAGIRVGAESPLESQVIAAINAYRGSQGAQPLSDSPVLAALARAHSQEMLALGYFGHDSPTGQTAADRLSSFFVTEGYGQDGHLPVGENIALAPGPGDANAFLQTWTADPDHLAILLGTGEGPLYASVGVGVATADSAPGVYAGRGQVTVVTAVFGPPQPEYGKSVLVAPVSGVVLVQPPGAKTFTPLTDVTVFEAGTQVDTTKGRVTLTSGADDQGNVQSADFYQGRFGVTYTPDFPGGSPYLLTNLQLSGPLTGCSPPVVPRRLAGPVAAGPQAKPKPKPKQTQKPSGPTTRALWGTGKGSFRTQAAFASATVRGTVWFTQDTCTGSLVRVQQGVVDVFDIKRRTHTQVPAGQSIVVPR